MKELVGSWLVKSAIKVDGRDDNLQQVIWMNGPMASNTSSNQILKQQQTLFCLL
jgi:hypothetical protein